MRVNIQPLTFRDACFIAANIRQQDWDECRCQIEEENKFALAQLCYFGTEESLMWSASLDGQPVSAFGVISTGPTLYQLWMWSTPRVKRVLPAVVKFLDVQLRTLLIERGARRLEIRAYEEHDFVRKGWLEKVGAIPSKEPLLQYGKNGETFRLYTWWKGMSDEKDIRLGYNRVRRTESGDAVRFGGGNKQLSYHGHDLHGSGRGVLLHDAPDRKYG